MEEGKKSQVFNSFLPQNVIQIQNLNVTLVKSAR